MDVSRSPAYAVIDHFRGDVIVPASPIVLRNDDRGVRPIGAVPNRVDNRRYPGWPTAVVGQGVIGTGSVRNDPGDLRELPIGDIHQGLCLRDDDVSSPIRASAGERAIDGLLLADVLYGIGRRPDGTGGRSIVAPRDALTVEQVGEGGMFETRILGRLVGLAACGIDNRYGLRQRGDASCGAVIGIFRGE
jgi:hypothetical protein